MKILKMRVTYTLFSIFPLVLIAFCHQTFNPTSYPAPHQDSTIVGTWISEEDSSWTLMFTAGNKCFDYYEEALTDSSTYSISNTSPQCGQNVPVGNYTEYLQLTSLKNGDKTCYEVNGITSKTLSLSVIDKGGAFVFNRQ